MSARVLVAMLLAATLAHAASPETPELDAERDQLLEKIAGGVDYEASVRRFAALAKQRDAIVATSAEAKAREAKQRADERAEHERRRAIREAYHKTNDYEVSSRCTLSPDPAHPIASREGRFKPDWGKVVRKESIRFPPKNALDEGERATLYEVKGAARSYVFRGDTFDAWRKPFNASVGDLVLVCDGGEGLERRLPPAWGDRLLTSGFAVRLAEPPHVVDKTRWNPIHVTGSAFWWMIHDVKLTYPPESFLLSSIEIDKDLGDGRYEITADRNRGMSYLIEVPKSVKHQDLLVPGNSVWAILGEPRFDKALKKLILTVQDLEARYIVDR